MAIHGILVNWRCYWVRNTQFQQIWRQLLSMLGLFYSLFYNLVSAQPIKRYLVLIVKGKWPTTYLPHSYHENANKIRFNVSMLKIKVNTKLISVASFTQNIPFIINLLSLSLSFTSGGVSVYIKWYIIKSIYPVIYTICGPL